MDKAYFSVETKWQDHLNGRWCAENCDILANQDSVKLLYNELIFNKELIPISSSNVLQNDSSLLPDFEWETLLPSELNHYITTLLSSQLELARNVCSSTTFSVILKQRLAILKRIFFALWMRYHEKEKTKSIINTNSHNENNTNDLNYSGSQALVELGVQTGISLLFALLKQNWENTNALGIPSVCNDVLRTALEMVQNLPPLTLSHDNHLTPLGVKSLEKVSKFLQETVLETSGTNLYGQLASELLLSIALQRGSLHFILEWIQMALDTSCPRRGKLSYKTLEKALYQMHGDCISPIKLRNFGNEVDLYDAAMCIMEELVKMALDHESTCTKPLRNESENIHALVEKSEAYIWGSNSSHQLAEGVIEKIIVPTLSTPFAQAQQVKYNKFKIFFFHHLFIIFRQKQDNIVHL